MVTTLSSRQFQQNANQAQKAASDGPVIITNRGRPAHVLLNYDDYLAITGMGTTIVDALAMPGLSDIEFDIPKSVSVPRPADLS